jgi:hypothetical protein
LVLQLNDVGLVETLMARGLTEDEAAVVDVVRGMFW